jgi:hypothetical protein
MKSTGRKALILVSRLARRVPRPETFVYWFRAPLSVAAPQIGTLNGTASSSLNNMLAYWKIGYCNNTHPYGHHDGYYQDRIPLAAARGIQYNQYRWPPRSNVTNYFQPGAVAGASPRSGTVVPGYANQSGGGIAATGTEYGNIIGTTHKFHWLRIRGQIVMTTQDAAEATPPEDDMSHKLNLDNVVLYKGDATVWLRIVWVQQFKENVSEPDLTPTDVYRSPFYTSIHATEDLMENQANWLNMDKTSDVKANQPVDYDVGRQSTTVAPTTPAAPVPQSGVGLLPHRTRKFRVIKEYQLRFSDTDLETRRLRTVNVDEKFYPAKSRMEVISSTTVPEAPSESDQVNMSPCFLWLIPSQSTTTPIVRQTAAPFSAPDLFERMDIQAVYSDI